MDPTTTKHLFLDPGLPFPGQTKRAPRTRCGAPYPGGGINPRRLSDADLAAPAADVCPACLRLERENRRIGTTEAAIDREYAADRLVDDALEGTPGYERRTMLPKDVPNYPRQAVSPGETVCHRGARTRSGRPCGTIALTVWPTADRPFRARPAW